MTSKPDSSLHRNSSPRGGALFWPTIKQVYAFSFFLNKRSKRSRLFALLCFFPILLSIFLRVHQTISADTSFDGLYLFTNAILLFVFQFLVLILALFYGSAVCSEDLEAGTWPYLVTRPLPRPTIVIAKYWASLTLMALMSGVGVITSFIILNLERWAEFSLYIVLLKDLGVLVLGLMAYTSFFAFLGAVVRRSVFFGLIFSFGWENVIQYFPGSTQRFAIIHYLKSLLPLPWTSRFSFLTFRLEPTKPFLAVIALLIITVTFLALACLVFIFKEPRAED